MLLAHYLVIPAAASEITAPAVPRSGLEMMPEETGDFGNGVLQILQKAENCRKVLTIMLLSIV